MSYTNDTAASPAKSNASSSSTTADSPVQPQTPLSPSLDDGGISTNSSSETVSASTNSSASNAAAMAAAAAAKRKPSRRANTAERRATHNAVERARRETLNGRFLDLAALLPNLSQIRRPSKSAIVNSSIAHLHAARRHRALAAREMRALYAESLALRRELNEWRDRSGLPRVEEPPRGEGWGVVMSGEVEVLVSLDEDGEEGGWEEDGNDEGMQMGGGAMDSMMTHQQHQHQHQQQQQQAMMAEQQRGQQIFYQQQQQAPVMRHAHSHPASVPTMHHLHQQQQQQQQHHHPLIAPTISATSFENPAMLGAFEPSATGFPHISPVGGLSNLSMSLHGSNPSSSAPNIGSGLDEQKLAAWNTHLAQQQAHQAQHHLQHAQQQLLQQQQQLRAAQLARAQQQQGMQYGSMNAHGMYGSEDDSSSVHSGSFRGGSPGSGASPVTSGMVASPTSASFDFGGSFPAPSNGNGRRASINQQQWAEDAAGVGMISGLRSANVPIAVGGGGSGGSAGFGSMGMMLAM